MRCEDFEVDLSEYIEGELSAAKTQRMEKHALDCTVCTKTLTGVLQVRRALYGLGAINPPATFKLGLYGFLLEKLARRRRLWARPLTLGVALAMALAILLWPEQPDERVEQVTWETQDRLVKRQLGRVWVERFPELSRPGPYSQAHARAASF